MHDADVEVGDEHDHGGSCRGSSDADEVRASGDEQGELAVGVDAVVADAFVGCGPGVGVALAVAV